MVFDFDPSIFRVYKSAAEVRTSSAFELYPGDFVACMTRWNPGSVYISETGFAPFAIVIRGVAPTFKWHGETRLGRPQLKALLVSLERLGNGLVHARTAADLLRLNPKCGVPEDKAALARAQLIRSAEDVADVVWRALCRPGVLWVIGP